MRLTGPGIWGPPANRREALAVVRRAIELDVNLIDTAASYGPHISEELIAEALHPYPAGLVIATKAGLERPGPDRWTQNGRPDRLRADLEGSLRRLRVSHIDLYQLHRIDPAVPEAEQFGAFQRFQQEGKIRHVGLSEATVEQIERARSFFTVASVQNRYNLGDREWEEVLDHCHAQGIAFMPWFPLLVGQIGKGDLVVQRIGARHQATPVQIALAWLLRRSSVMLPIPGTSRVDHLEENIAASAIRLTDEEFAALSAIRAAGRWRKRAGGSRARVQRWLEALGIRRRSDTNP
jgi:aryl-alcohol dehydrogenase-like predicted oxidoreductase